MKENLFKRITLISVIGACAFVLTIPLWARAQSGSPSPNVPKETGKPSKEAEAQRQGGGKGLSGQQPTHKGKDSQQQQQEQMERKHSGK
ncbi:MAG TPA: hypothetical protein VJ692_00820 [Nitrospiraceae bacterium]|nr:hypothetical protein [Nitrospiraceae bacterium]